jgi:hypothetical protein
VIASVWQPILDAFLEGRMSASTFCRRFTEAFDDVVARGQAVPSGIQALHFVVDAYAGDPTARGNDVADDEDLRAAAIKARAEFAPADAQSPGDSGPQTQTAPGPDATYSAAEAEQVAQVEEAIRTHVRTAGMFAGVGCAIMIAFLAVCVMQFFAVSAQVQSALGWGPAPSTIAGLVLAVIPIVGSVIAFFGAKDVWNWSPFLAAIVFLTLPILVQGSAFMRWLRSK